MRIILVIQLLLLSNYLFAQSEDADQSLQRAPSSLHPGEPVQRQEVRTKKTRKLDKEDIIRIYGGKVESRKEFEARMVRTVKQIRKREKGMKKPQYSDPMYFGHKRPPKKHKAGHLKFCKECGIRH
ncbi:MAG TPA: hypothetical protein VD927_19305 [Chryseosolibacter sp.]|nr:hypothetical protein [Chryseosolibacter sp.]